MGRQYPVAVAEPERQRGRKGDRFVPSSSPRLRRGPVTRRGGASSASGAGRSAALTGNVAVGGSQAGKRPPVTHSGLLTETAIAWFFFGVEPEKENHHDGRECEHGI